MEATVSSSRSKLYDSFRKKALAIQPEEVVRQKLLHHMVDALGFPKGYLCVERSLAELCDGERVPDRRIDIVAYYKKEGALQPLLLIECKAGGLKESMLEQVFGYNHYLNAPFVALTNGTATYVGVYVKEENKYSFSEGLPSYETLCSTSA